MGFDFSGYVIRPPQIAPINAVTTAEPTTGVVREAQTLPQVYDLPSPVFVDVRADQYRTAILNGPGTSQTEYLLWAQNTGSLARVDDSTWWVEQGTGTIPVGTFRVTNLNPGTVPLGTPVPVDYGYCLDGTTEVIVQDDGGRSLSSILALVIARGDITYDDEGWVDEEDPSAGRNGSNPYPVLIPTVDEYNSVSGVVTLNSTWQMILDGGLSNDRGDTIIDVRYTLSPAKFWWARNDRYENRFGWNGKTQRWEPYKGSPPQNVGILQPDTSYTLSPKVKNLPVNSYLPGDPALDEYSMIRLGEDPGRGTPVDKIRVRPNLEVESTYDFTLDPTSNGIVGQTNGILQFNPAFTLLNAGKTIWYSYKGFQSDADGVLGKLLDALTNPLYLAPIPGPTDNPLIKLGNRHYLQVSLVDTEADLVAVPDPLSGYAIVALSTGRVRLSLTDIHKSDPTSTSFDKSFFGEDVVYDGVALNQIPQPTTKPVPLVDSTGTPATVGSGTLYIPGAAVLPTEFTSPDIYRGLGVSGVLDVSDGTGAHPDNSGSPASVRPGGDALGDITTGRIRQVTSGIGDAFVFSRKGTFQTLKVYDRSSDLPIFFRVQKGTACVAKEATSLGWMTWGSEVRLGRQDSRDFDGEYLYYLQSDVTPAVYTGAARIYSRGRDIFRFSANQTLYFSIDYNSFTWVAPTAKSFYTAAEVAADIEAILTVGRCYARNGRVVLESDDPATGNVEIGWGGTTADLSGAEILGFLPGWRVQGGVPNWLPDSGASFGVFRSPMNTDGSNATPDMRSEVRVEDNILVDPVQENPFVFLTYPPLQDVAGYDEGVFFNLRTTLTEGETVQLVDKRLQNYVDIIHRFGQSKFDWVSRSVFDDSVENATTTLSLGETSVVPESLLGAPGIGGSLSVSADGGPYVLQVQDKNYLLPQGGSSGIAQLVEQFGARVSYGARGRFIAGSGGFSDPDADFSLIQPGYRLKVLTGDISHYIVQSVTSLTTMVVSPAFSSTPVTPVVWELYEGYQNDVYDPTLVVDMLYKEFNHLQSEPFVVHLLNDLGTISLGATLQANMQAALTSGRPISLRYGLQGSAVTLTALKQTLLGVLANSSLTLPDTTSNRFLSGSFAVKVGTQNFPNDGTHLNGVTSFTPGLLDGIEYLTVTGTDGPVGRLNFGTHVLSDYASAKVYYVEEFQPEVDLTAGTAEYNPLTGALNLAYDDIVTYMGDKAYFVSQMITEQHQDVSLNPILGAFAFSDPVPKGSLVEVSYWLADLNGAKVPGQITEFLPTFIRSETATRQKENVYVFNTAGNTVLQAVQPSVYIGPIQQNFGTTDFLVDYLANGQGRITFVSHVVPDYVPVTVSYAIYEAQGGEKAYGASQRPIYRPPFFITAGQNRFGVRGNRTAEFTPGQMFRFGEDCFYIKSISYYPPTPTGGDVTAIYIVPPTVREVGSRSPGNDVLAVITADPITTVVDPDGTAPVITSAPAGFMSVIDINLFPFEPVSRGQKEIVFNGNLMQFAVPGHIFEIGGYPYTISSAALNEDGTRTKISVTSGFQTGFSVEGKPTVKLSYRPVYPPGTRETVGVGPVLADQSYEAILFGSGKPGATLRVGVDYELVPETGVLRFISLDPKGMEPGEKLFFTYTAQTALQPFWKDGAVSFPRYHADFLYGATPDKENGYLGAQVTATYTFSNPDSFYLRLVRMPTFLAEAAQEAVKEIQAQQPASGAMTQSAGGANNWENGRRGILGERKHLTDKDRAARTLLNFYNTTIESFEQVKETISGGFIGDQDGKFRFFVGYGKPWYTPGYEDDIKGLLTIRNVWGDVFTGDNPAFDAAVLTTDWVVDPKKADLVGGEITGWLPDSKYLQYLISRQKALVHNEVDDEVLVGTGKKHNTYVFLGAYFKVLSKAKGIYYQMWQEHKLSRLFPTVTKAFTYTGPGVGGDPNSGDFGFFTAGRVIDGESVSTNGTVIGQLQNPPLGEITNVSSASLKRRYPRSRVWEYFPEGLPAALFPLLPNPSYPCIMAVPDLLSDILIDPQTGFPDPTQFLSQGGTLPDAQSGDPDLAIPGFSVGDQLRWGKPGGTLYNLYTPVGFPIFGQTLYKGVFASTVYYGCIITLQDADGDLISSSDAVLVGTSPDSGVPLEQHAEQGDTVFVGKPTGSKDIVNTTPVTPLSYQDFKDMSKGQGSDSFRSGTDVSVRTDGTLEDITLPSFDDPVMFGLKEMTGQNPPPPMTPIEGTVNFLYNEQNPYEFPALQGLVQDDSGDYQIPYMKAGNTELDRFAELSNLLPKIITTTDPIGGYVYPDEALGSDGEVVGAVTGGVDPAILFSTQADVLEKTHHPAYLGVGDVQPYDLLLIQVEGTSPFSTNGVMGIHTVGAVDYTTGSVIEPPRFQTYTADLPLSTKTAPAMQYAFENYAVYVDPASPVYPDHPQTVFPAPPGVVVVEDTATNEVILEFSSVSHLVLCDGQTADTGGLNDIHTADPDNVIRIDLYSRRDLDVSLPPPPPWPTNPGGGLVLSIFIKELSVWTEDYRGVVTGPFGALTQFGHSPSKMQIKIQPVASILPWSACPPGFEDHWVMPHSFGAGIRQSLYGSEYSVSVDTTAGKSTTAWVAPDRLTFNEVIDMRWMTPRGYVHPLSLLPLESSLHITKNYQFDGTPALYWSSLLSYANGGTPFTFVPRANPFPNGLGTWAIASLPATVERGSIKVMAFEGWNNTPITGTDATFSVVPSDSQFEGGVIFSGAGKTESLYDSIVPNASMYDNRVTEIPWFVGSYSNVLPGDVLVIQSNPDSNYPATPKAGTYLVKHAVEPTGIFPYREVSPSTTIGSGAGWCPTQFPKTVSFNQSTFELTVSFLPPASASPVTVGSKTSAFELTGRVYIIRNVQGLTSLDATTYAQSVIYADYAGLVSPATEAVFSTTVGTYGDALGNPLTTAEFAALLDKPYPVSGMSYLQMNVAGELGLPLNNCEGYHNTSAFPKSVQGVHFVTLNTQNIFGATATVYQRYSADLGAIVSGISTSSGVGWLGVLTDNLLPPTAFQADSTYPVYPHVPRTLDIGKIKVDQWNATNRVTGSYGDTSLPPNVTYVTCLLPGMQVALEDLLAHVTGFYAQGGVFLEPTFIRSAINLVATHPRVVDSTHTLPAVSATLDETRELGMRDAHYYGSLATDPDDVLFEVRRIRRFHNTTVGDSFLALRYAYEIRRGVITGYDDTNPKQRGRITASAGTTLGYFNDINVNVHPGDSFRLLTADGSLLESVEIIGVEDATTLKLATLLENTPVLGVSRFEVWLRQAPVPHEQSNEQLLDLITEKVVLKTAANWTTNQGGKCTVNNQLLDPTQDFLASGVKVGDIVVVDPVGAIPQVGVLPSPQEYGQPPLGDDGVPLRTSFSAGIPSDLDDNRGYYRVKKVVAGSPQHLVLDPLSTFTGDATNNVTFGSGTYEYAVYPTVSGPPAEGQMDLRQTHLRDPITKSYKGTAFSIEPFSYRIIRPSALFSTEAVDLVLMMRERMLTLVEKLRYGKFGSYYVFQRDGHISDLGSFTDPNDGLGVMPNAYIVSLLGNVGIVPFMNNRYCMSLLDRRFWILDEGLDSLTTKNQFEMQLVSSAPPGTLPYTGYNDDTPGGGGEVRPVLPDRIDLVLDQTDRFRDIRYIWLAYRVHRVLGTLSAIQRFDKELPNRLAEQKTVALLSSTVEIVK